MQDACIAFSYAVFLSDLCSVPSGPKTSGATTTSTDTSRTIVRARFVLLKGGNDSVDLSFV